MAPELALQSLEAQPQGSVILDPMAGSGTVPHQAKALGLTALGFDLDPLAVMISRVATTVVDDRAIVQGASALIGQARQMTSSSAVLPWLDGDMEGEAFVSFWFGDRQRDELRRIAHWLCRAEEVGLTRPVADVLRIALSRIIVTKKAAASLAQDTSHSRPHKVLDESDYDVFDGFERSLRSLRKRLARIPTTGHATIGFGDARELSAVCDVSVDLVLTSPPYLNAIDYMRGHKMSLIWLGHSLRSLTTTRSNSIGAERRPTKAYNEEELQGIKLAMGRLGDLPSRYQGMIDRYALDLAEMTGQVARVLKPGATATFVMGNSCLRGTYIENSAGLIAAGALVGLRDPRTSERPLPSQSRYLPTPTAGNLSKRMRKEVIVSLTKA
jgi:hypothetical protein